MHTRTRARRLSHETRREQIIDVTLDLVAEFGVGGTTLSRIAAGVGVTTPALYAHFANRKEILLAALDVLFERRTLPHRCVPEGSAVDRIRAIEHCHRQLLASDDDRSVFALFEFIVAPPEEGLRRPSAESISCCSRISRIWCARLKKKGPSARMRTRSRRHG